ncbi:hypothetical protein N8I71_00850 [Roseibacterium sp. SDUM158016]|uniref:hypothetical protein n=1 Tax=Roseicyclus sediminis TaxID=2980997 RepID=UPI0021CFEF31|nr:hypothetical protein [Roseibacterium sp. SDUM158016]MCU4651364.1 hypothetical protein [Roseibacterium sp. SDUM158016]
MAEFLRPEVAAMLRRWREPLVALVVIAAGLWIAARPGPIVQGFGWVLAGLGAMALIPAIRRARFAASGEAPGVVQVDERRIVYMGPTHGGAIALDELEHLSLRRLEDGRAAWILAESGALLMIPVEARGAEALFDAFTALPGLSAQAILAARDMPQAGTTRLWTRAQDRARIGHLTR